MVERTKAVEAFTLVPEVALELLIDIPTLSTCSSLHALGTCRLQEHLDRLIGLRLWLAC